MMWAKQTLGKRAENWDLSDLSSSIWKDGTAILALINEFRPDLVDMDKVEKMSKEERVRLALGLACEKFGVDASILTEKDFLETLRSMLINLPHFCLNFVLDSFTTSMNRRKSWKRDVLKMRRSPQR